MLFFFIHIPPFLNIMFLQFLEKHFTFRIYTFISCVKFTRIELRNITIKFGLIFKFVKCDVYEIMSMDVKYHLLSRSDISL